MRWLAVVIYVALCGIAAAASVTVACCDVGSIRGNATLGFDTILLGPGRFTGNCSDGVMLAATGQTVIGASTASTIIDCQFSGRVFSNVLAPPPLTFLIANLTIVNTRARSCQGGAIRFVGANATVQNVVFVNSTADDAGALAVMYNDNTVYSWTVVSGCSFTNCANTLGLPARAGGAFYSQAWYTTIDGSTFTSNTGCIGVATTTVFNRLVTLTNSRFVNNLCAGHGAFTAGGGGGNVIVRDTTFTGNTAMPLTNWTNTDYTSSLDLYSIGNVTLQNVAVLNSVQQGGAAVMVASYANLNVYNLTVTGCSAFAYPFGMTYFTAGSGITFLSGSTFTQNVATNMSSGGALVLRSTMNSTITNCIFDSNTAWYDAGHVVICGTPNTTIINTVFRNGRATNGGAVVVNNCGLVVFNSASFVGNTASNDHGFGSPFGGALFSIDSSVTLAQCYFTGSAALRGAAVAYSTNGLSPTAIITNSIFEYNYANERGAALYFDGTHGATVSVVGSTFRFNRVDVIGGAICQSTTAVSTVSITSSTFTSNTAGTNGGAVYLTNAALSITGSVSFLYNLAYGRGGSVYHQAGSIIYIDARANFTGNNLTTPSPGFFNMEADFTGVGGCSSLPAAAGASLVTGCPGSPGFICTIKCTGADFPAPGAPSCNAGAFPAYQCVTPVVRMASYGGVDDVSIVANYGTLGVPRGYPATISRRVGSQAYVTPLIPHQVVIFGGNGWNEANVNMNLDDLWIFNTTDFAAPTVTWIGGSKNAATGVPQNSATNTSGGVNFAGGWACGTTAYLFAGGFAPTSLPTLWRLDLLNPATGWKFVGGPGSNPTYGAVGTPGVPGPTVWPNINTLFLTYQILDVLPHHALVFGGVTSGTSDAIWIYDCVLMQWAYIRGTTTNFPPPVYGTRGVPDINNTPGGRTAAAGWSTNDTFYLWGGYRTSDTWLNDLWSGTYSLVTHNVTWTWLAGNSASVYGVDPSARCSSCIPSAKIAALGISMPGLTALGFPPTGYIHGGLGPQLKSCAGEIWEMQPTVPSYTHVAGDTWIPPDTQALPYQYPLPLATPSGRAYHYGWADPERPGIFYTFGGVTYLKGQTGSTYGAEQTAFAVLTGMVITGPTTALVGASFNVNVVLRKNSQNSTTVTATNLKARASVGSVTMLSAGFVSNVATLSLSGVPSNAVAGAPVTITFTLYDYLQANLTLQITCPSVGNCTAVSCSTPADVVCATCLPGFYASGHGCVPCDAACTTCTGPGAVVAGNCVCNAAGYYGVLGASCVACGPSSGSYVNAGGVCTTCPSVANCALPTTCTTATNMVCPECLFGTTLGAGPPAGRGCRGCATCTGGQYVGEACTTLNDTLCTACPPVSGCTGRVGCTNANDSACVVCQPSYYLSGITCQPCGTCPMGKYQETDCTAVAPPICLRCQDGCAACTGFGITAARCQACDEAGGYLWNIDHSSCVTSCPVGEWAAPRNATGPGSPAACVACAVGCSECAADGLAFPGACSVCDEDAGYLIASSGAACVHGCPPGDFANNTMVPHRCESCSGAACQAGMYKTCADTSTFTCTACTPGCLTCTGEGLDTDRYCTACDESSGYAVDANGVCTRCAANCTLCHGSPTTCVGCADGYENPPACTPVCSSPGCMGCLSPDACAICGPTFMGGDCKQCSSLAAAGSPYPDCQASRVTDPTGTGAVLGALAFLLIIVTLAGCYSPLPVFYHGMQMIATPAEVVPLQVDFVLTKRKLRLVLQPTIPIISAFLEGKGLLPKSLALEGGETFQKGEHGVSMQMTNKQVNTFLAGGYRVDLTVDPGAGPVLTKFPLHVPMRRNLPNFIAAFTILLDFVQLSSSVFGSNVAWWSKDPVPSVLKYSILLIPPNLGLWYIFFWLLTGIALVWAILVIFIKTGLDAKLCGDRVLMPIYGTFMPVVGQTLFLPIINVMVGVMSCSRAVTQDSSASNYSANFDPRIQCWASEHWLYVVVAAVVILVFYPLAIYTFPLWQTTNAKLDVRYFPAYLVATGQVKFVLALTGQLFSTVPLVQCALLIGLCLPIVLIGLRRPISVIHLVRAPVICSYTAVAWVGVSSIVAVLRPDNWLSSVLLYSGWGVLLIACIVATMKSGPAEEIPDDANAVLAVRRVMHDIDADSSVQGPGAAYVALDEKEPGVDKVLEGETPVAETAVESPTGDEFAAIVAVTDAPSEGAATEVDSDQPKTAHEATAKPTATKKTATRQPPRIK